MNIKDNIFYKTYGKLLFPGLVFLFLFPTIFAFAEEAQEYYEVGKWKYNQQASFCTIEIKKNEDGLNTYNLAPIRLLIEAFEQSSEIGWQLFNSRPECSNRVETFMPLPMVKSIRVPDRERYYTLHVVLVQAADERLLFLFTTRGIKGAMTPHSQ